MLSRSYKHGTMVLSILKLIICTNPIRPLLLLLQKTHSSSMDDDDRADQADELEALSAILEDAFVEHGMLRFCCTRGVHSRNHVLFPASFGTGADADYGWHLPLATLRTMLWRALFHHFDAACNCAVSDGGDVCIHDAGTWLTFLPPHPASHPICLGIGHPGAKNFPASVRPGTEDWVGGVIAVRLELDDLLELRVNLGGKEKAYKVSHLPPLELAFRFPPTYPSADPPALALGCPWLTQAQLETVIHLLDAEWDSYVGMSVIFRLVEILKASDTNTDINTSTPPAVAVAAVARPSGWWGRGCIFRAGCSFSPLLCTQPI